MQTIMLPPVSVHRKDFSLDGVELGSLDCGMTALLGNNGSGKTTLLESLVDALQEQGVRVGFLPQRFSLPPFARVRTFLSFVASQRLPRADWESAVGLALRRANLEHKARSRIGGLSGGMRQRLAIAATLIGEPAAIFLDEPDAALDVEQTDRLYDLLHDLAESLPVLLSSHAVDSLAPRVDRLVVLQPPRVVFDGSPGELGADSPDGVRAGYKALVGGVE